MRGPRRQVLALCTPSNCFQPSLGSKIWLLVIAHLSRADIRLLLGVDRQLTNIALNVHYRTAVAAPYFMGRYFEELCNFM